MRRISSCLNFALLFLVVFSIQIMLATSKIPAFIKRSRAKYTPLLFFKVPMGQMSESDEMEKVVRSLEKETGLKVQRLDIMKDRAAKKLYEKLIEGNLRSPFPLLYHRESLQRVYGLADKDLVKSWSKGRLLPVVDEKKVTVLPGVDDDAMEEEMDLEEMEMEMDRDLTPVQRKGKEAMKKRMEDGRKKK